MSRNSRFVPDYAQRLRQSRVARGLEEERDESEPTSMVASGIEGSVTGRGNSIFAGFDAAAIIRSSDDGIHWAAAFQPPPNRLSGIVGEPPHMAVLQAEERMRERIRNMQSVNIDMEGAHISMAAFAERLSYMARANSADVGESSFLGMEVVSGRREGRASLAAAYEFGLAYGMSAQRLDALLNGGAKAAVAERPVVSMLFPVYDDVEEWARYSKDNTLTVLIQKLVNRGEAYCGQLMSDYQRGRCAMGELLVSGSGVKRVLRMSLRVMTLWFENAKGLLDEHDVENFNERSLFVHNTMKRWASGEYGIEFALLNLGAGAICVGETAFILADPCLTDPDWLYRANTPLARMGLVTDASKVGASKSRGRLLG